ncbi:MAG: hypothetical protein IH851_05385 [Armatimonadetes bacterium]|nr:hypothetical protein [Armatimonadota bacterium]
MKTGNPKAVAVLTAIAVAAVGFALYRFVPSGRLIEAVGGERASQGEGEPSAPDLSANVYTDPFWHPALVRPESGAVVHPPGVPAGPGGSSGPLNPMAGNIQTEPEDITGSGQQSEERRPQRSVILKAIVRVRRPAVMLSVDGARSKAFALGDEVFDGVRVAEILEGSVVLSAAEWSVTVRLGEMVYL